MFIQNKKKSNTSLRTSTGYIFFNSKGIAHVDEKLGRALLNMPNYREYKLVPPQEPKKRKKKEEVLGQMSEDETTTSKKVIQGDSYEPNSDNFVSIKNQSIDTEDVSHFLEGTSPENSKEIKKPKRSKKKDVIKDAEA